MPDETTIAPYRVSFALTLASGLTRLLEKAADPPYALTPFERLSLDAVTVRAQ